MIPTTAPDPAVMPLGAVMDAVQEAVLQVIKAVDNHGHIDLGAFSLVDTLRAWETIRNLMPVVDRALIQHGTEQGAAKVVSQKSMTQVLMTGLRLSSGEASRRVKAAAHLADRRSPLGESLVPIREHLSAAQRDGLVTPEQVSLIDETLRKVKHCDPKAVEAGELLLVDQASKLGFKDLQRVAVRLVEAIDPDGTLPADEAEHRLRRFLHCRQRKDGAYVGEFRLTPEVGQKLMALLGPLTDPQHTTVTPEDEDGVAGRKQVIPDERTVGQRRHDALEDVLDAALRSSERPETQNGSPATLILTFTWAEFTQVRGGVGSYADGTPVSAQTARLLAREADVAFCVKSAKGAVLDLYRSRRIASPAQTLALIARDSGCSFPGCEVAPQFCERHHVIAWWDDGETNIGNLTLLCGFHHKHFAEAYWRCVINADGLPVWIPPKWIDPQQRPLINHRILLNNWTPGEPLDLQLPFEDDEPPDPPGPPD